MTNKYRLLFLLALAANGFDILSILVPDSWRLPCLLVGFALVIACLAIDMTQPEPNLE